ncbi:MAG: STAS domain-containing protein [Kiritimatiellia bacterium]
MTATFLLKNGVGVVVVAGELTSASIDSFRDQFMAWWQSQPELRNVVVDLTGVDLLDSSGLGALVALLKRVSERGGDLKIAGLQKKVRMVFEITRAFKVFDIFDQADEALQACE